ncbi:glycoside hydrolase domain-containing protein [Phycisphaerales bacterium AB-hyl4]|uniref:Glycoside hydrolase domain-containing protein n=1 Tax=Natronomicrosphaera hydrolytica TaxID=3242702 RepID=A0ABV4UAK6_9BACT
MHTSKGQEMIERRVELFNTALTLGVVVVVTASLFAMISVSHAESSVDVHIADFEEGMGGAKAFSDPFESLPNARPVRYGRTRQWATSGSYSLRIDAPAHRPGKTTAWPGVTLNAAALPVRDWRPYQYLTLDVKVTQPNTPVFVLVQRSSRRMDRVRWHRHNMGPGEYRIWMSIPGFVSGGDVESVADVIGLQLLLRMPDADKTVFFDNIQLRSEFTPRRSTEDLLGIDSEHVDEVEQLLGVPELLPPVVDYVETLTQTDVDRTRSVVDRLKRIRTRTETLTASAETEARLASDFPSRPFGAYVAPIDERVAFDGHRIGDRWRTALDTVMARGETRSHQLCLVRRRDADPGRLTVDISDFVDRASGETLPDELLEIGLDLVGYVYLGPNSDRERSGFERPGWYADPLLSWDGSIDIEAPRVIQPLLLTLKASHDAPPGRYIGTVTVSQENSDSSIDDNSVQVPVELEIVAVDMPVQPSLNTLVAVGYYGQNNPDFFLDYRISPNSRPYGSIYLRQSEPAVDLEKISELVKKGMTTFNLHQAYEMEIFEWRNQHGIDGAAERFVERIDARYPSQAWDRMAESGLLDHAVIYGFDETYLNTSENRQTIKAVFGSVKERYPQIRTASTAQKMEIEYLDLPIDIWIPSLDHFDVDVAREAQARGREVWTYTIDWEIWRPLVWSRALPWGIHQQGSQGWLYYNFSDWSRHHEREGLGEDPLTSWDPISWPSAGRYGTGGLVYRDRSGDLRGSLRLVNFREGMFDHDLITAIKRLAEDEDTGTIGEKAQRLLDHSRTGLILDFVEAYGGVHTPMQDSIGRSMDQWRDQALRLLAEETN